jgi:hypothetical protein
MITTRFQDTDELRLTDAERDASLRRALLRKYRLAQLPRSVAARAWAGRAPSAAVCALCDSLIGHSENEFEVEWRAGSDVRILRLHVRCFWFWCAERDHPVTS